MMMRECVERGCVDKDDSIEMRMMTMSRESFVRDTPHHYSCIQHHHHFEMDWHTMERKKRMKETHIEGVRVFVCFLYQNTRKERSEVDSVR